MSGMTALLIVSAGLLAAPPAAPPRHLFLDPEFIAEKTGIALHVNPAELQRSRLFSFYFDPTFAVDSPVRESAR